jgi:hypothetical protein
LLIENKGHGIESGLISALSEPKLCASSRPMKLRVILSILLLCLVGARAEAAPDREIILISGGVSLYAWEKFKAQPHDSWWMNFIRAARLRIQEIQAGEPDAQITWFVYKPSYIARGRQDHRDYISDINSVRDVYHVKLIYFDHTPELINYLNGGQPRDRVKISDLEFFGHSNKACWMFDYSNNLDSASKAWLHEKELGQINRTVFTRDAFVKSWGCHTGESMSKRWRSATGVPMWGAIGKTQYMTDEMPILSSDNGRWVK